MSKSIKWFQTASKLFMIMYYVRTCSNNILTNHLNEICNWQIKNGCSNQSFHWWIWGIAPPLFTFTSFYRPQRSWGKVIFSQASVILFTGGGLPQCMLGYHPPPPRDQAGIPPLGAEHTGRYGQREGGMHPTAMQSCLERNWPNNRLAPPRPRNSTSATDYKFTWLPQNRIAYNLHDTWI